MRRKGALLNLHRVALAVDLWRERRRSRAQLARLTLHQLKDIGVTPGEALFEMRKPFWRA